MRGWTAFRDTRNRYQIELIPPAEQLSLSYYGKHLIAFTAVLAESGLVTALELSSGKAAPNSATPSPPLQPEQVAAFLEHGAPATREGAVTAKFRVGQTVRARNINPAGHTRLPRYARGKLGSIATDHGVFVFPDTNVADLDEKPQHVYSVQFAARELWGEEASPRDSVYIDMWDDYLEPA
jgi:nitrile hydratase